MTTSHYHLTEYYICLFYFINLYIILKIIKSHFKYVSNVPPILIYKTYMHCESEKEIVSNSGQVRGMNVEVGEGVNSFVKRGSHPFPFIAH